MSNTLSSRENVLNPDLFKNTDGGVSGYRVLVATSQTSLERAITANVKDRSDNDIIVCHCSGMADQVRACMQRNDDTKNFPSYNIQGGPILNAVIASCARAGHSAIVALAKPHLANETNM